MDLKECAARAGTLAEQLADWPRRIGSEADREQMTALAAEARDLAEALRKLSAPPAPRAA
jgi:hypothetical protein